VLRQSQKHDAIPHAEVERMNARTEKFLEAAFLVALPSAMERPPQNVIPEPYYVANAWSIARLALSQHPCAKFDNGAWELP
jgi:hypothetical protein